jgi:hypothetical protein
MFQSVTATAKSPGNHYGLQFRRINGVYFSIITRVESKSGIYRSQNFEKIIKVYGHHFYETLPQRAARGVFPQGLSRFSLYPRLIPLVAFTKIA